MKNEIKEIIELINTKYKDYYLDDFLSGEDIKKLVDYLNYTTNLQEENDYLKDIVSNTELSNEIKKADKWSKRELYKINYQRLQVNKKLRKENERLSVELNQNMIERNNYLSRFEKARELVKKLDNFDINADKYWNDLLNVLQEGDKNDN